MKQFSLLRHSDLNPGNYPSKFLSYIFFFILFFGCETKPKQYRFSGQTMGTTYSIAVISDNIVNSKSLQNGVDSVLTEVNRQMSTYIPDSEISQFNRWESIKPFAVSEDFAFVVQRALEINKLTNGAFDITVMPVVNLWGFFGSRNDNWTPPTDQIINKVIKNTGSDKLKVTGNSLQKLNPKLQIDVNAIAKGFGVDKVFNYLTDQGYWRCLVEIGGEVRCSGKNLNGNLWQIGIDKPTYGSMPGRELQEVIALEDQAMATSGDYRNFVEWNGEIFSHAIDPRTGCPVKVKVGSATVIAPTCLEADALATALMVMGEEAGVNLIQSLNDVECTLIIREENENFKVVNVKDRM